MAVTTELPTPPLDIYYIAMLFFVSLTGGGGSPTRNADASIAESG